MQAGRKRGTCWLYTIWYCWENDGRRNINAQSRLHLENWAAADLAEIRFLTYQLERGAAAGDAPAGADIPDALPDGPDPSTGYHFQLYAEFNNGQATHKTLSNLSGGRIRVGDYWAVNVKSEYVDRLRCKRYCNKEKTRIDGPYTHGSFVEITRGGGGSQARAAVFQMARDGHSVHQAVLKHPDAFRHHSSMCFIYKHLQVQRPGPRTERDIYLLLGKTGTGKTTFFMQHKDFQDVWRNTVNSTTGFWWDDYCDHKSVLLDDFNGANGLDIGSLLTLLDKYNVSGPTKGNSPIQILSSVKIAFTNQHLPHLWWPEKNRPQVDHLDALFRRFTHIGYALKRGRNENQFFISWFLQGQENNKSYAEFQSWFEARDFAGDFQNGKIRSAEEIREYEARKLGWLPEPEQPRDERSLDPLEGNGIRVIAKTLLAREESDLLRKRRRIEEDLRNVKSRRTDLEIEEEDSVRADFKSRRAYLESEIDEEEDLLNWRLKNRDRDEGASDFVLDKPK